MILPVLAALTGSAETRLVEGLAAHAGRVAVVRRPADMVELVAAAEAGVARAAVISQDFPNFDLETVTRLHAAGVRVVAVGDQDDRLRALGADDVVDESADAERVMAALLAGPPPESAGTSTRSAGAELGGTEPGGTTGWEQIAASGGRADKRGPGDTSDERANHGARASVITVWGTGGAPGRTTVAVNLAAHLAAAGKQTLLIDADSYGACAGAVLGLLDESAGLAAACRLAGRGLLDAAGLQSAAARVTDTFSVLTGISQASRWPELSRPRLGRVFEVARDCADVVVIDCAAPIEQDEELSYDTDAPQRNAATLAAMHAGDLVLLIGAADPIGLQRLVRAYVDAREQQGTVAMPIVNKLRTRVVGSPAKVRVADALSRFAGIDSPAMLPFDQVACDDALLRGVTLRESDSRSAASRAVAALATDLASRLPAGTEPVAGRRRRATSGG